MSKTNTRATIDANIKQNGQQLITGQILNSVLNTIVTDYAEEEKVTELERKVGDVEAVVKDTENITLTSSLTKGLLEGTDGSLNTSYKNWVTTDFVDVHPSMTIIFNKLFPNTGGLCGICLYDSAKSFIACPQERSTTDPNSGTINLADYPTARYARFSSGSSSIGTATVTLDYNDNLRDKVNGLERAIGFPYIVENGKEYAHNALYTTREPKGGEKIAVRITTDVSKYFAVIAYVSGQYVTLGTILDNDWHIFDYPSGSFSLNIQNLSGKNVTADIEIADNAIEQKIEDIQTRLSGAEPKISALQSDVSGMHSKVEAVNSLLDADNYTYNNGAGTTEGAFNWLWGTKGARNWVGVKKTYDTDILVKSLVVRLYDDKAQYDNTDGFTLYSGTIDQRGWFLASKSYESISCERLMPGIYKITWDNAIITKGEYVALSFVVKQSPSASFGIRENTATSHDVMFYTTNINNAVTEYASSTGLEYWLVSYVSVKSIFAYRADMNNIEQNIDSLNSKVNSANILVDKITGAKYRLRVSNGVLSAAPIRYQSVLYIGNSYTRHPVSTDVWFAVRAMAASVDATTYEELVKYKMGGTYGIRSIVSFEQNYNTLDIAATFGSLGQYDAIVVQGGENATYMDTMEDKWTELLHYLKVTYPQSDIYSVIGNVDGNRANAIINASAKENIPLVNFTGLNGSMVGKMRLGDYVTNTDGGYDYVRNRGVSDGHPSDVGMLYIANGLLNLFGEETINDRLYDITLTQTAGGTISTSYSKWVSQGIVSIKCEANEGKTISAMSVVNTSGNAVECVKRTNSYGVYYTFVMPASKVTITPTWV